MLVIHSGIARLFAYHSNKLLQSYYDALSVLNSLTYIANYENTVLTDLEFREDIINKLLPQLKSLNDFNEYMNIYLEKEKENKFPEELKELFDNIERLCKRLIIVIDILNRKIEEVEQQEPNIKNLKAVLIDKKLQLEKLLNKINQKIQ